MIYVGVIGEGECTESTEQLVYQVGSEIAFALKMCKPVIGIKTWRMEDGGGNIPPIKYANDACEAVKAALEAVLPAD